MIDVEVKGFNIFEKKLLRLETKASKKIIRRAVRDTGKVVQKEMKANAKSFVGGLMGNLIARNIIVRAQKKQRRGSFGVNVMLKSDVDEFVHITKKGKRHYIPAAIEWGHGSVKEISFMRSAWDKTKGGLLRFLLQRIKDLLLIEVKK